jgi:hypothetical protein
LTARERQRRTYDIPKEVARLVACRNARVDLRRQRDELVKVGADAAVKAVRAALATVEGAIRHAEHRLRHAQARATGEGRLTPQVAATVAALLGGAAS